MVSITSQFRHRILIQVFLFMVFLLLPVSLFGSESSHEEKYILTRVDWEAPESDNIYYVEDLEATIMKDGSVSKMWSLVDHGIGNISFPLPLPTPVNSSSDAIQDLRVRLAIVQHEEFPRSWGPVTYRDFGSEFIYDDDLESIISHIYLEFYVWMEDSDNQTLILPILDGFVNQLEELWEDVMFFKYSQSTSGLGSRRLRQVWRAFPSENTLKAVFEYLLDNCLPTNQGLFRVEKTDFLKASHKNIHLAAHWDGSEEGSLDAYSQEPYIDGDIENFDERWELIAGIYECNHQIVTIKENAMNRLDFNEIIPFSGSLGSHSKANYSELRINLYHGSQVITAKPNFINSPKYRSLYTLNMLDDSGEGSSYTLPDYSHLNFTDGTKSVPVLNVETTANKHIVEYGENVTLNYNVTNIGSETAYSVELEDDLSLSPRFADFTIIQGDSDSDGEIENAWEKIEPGESQSFQAIINCNESAGFFISNPDLEYHSSTYADLNEWERNPRAYSGGYEVYGQELLVLCNDSAAILTLGIDIPKTSVTIGDLLTINMTIKNVGDKNTTNVIWQAPIFGVNTSIASGVIENINPGETINLNSTFQIDSPLRYMGDFIEPGLYWEGFVEYLFRGDTPLTLDGIEIPLNIFPKADKEYGPLIILKKEQSELAIEPGKDKYYQVTIYAHNYGDIAAFNVMIDDNYPLENFTLVSGSPLVFWDYMPAGVEFSYSYIIKYPPGIPSGTQVSYLTATYDIGYQWYFGVSTEKTHSITEPMDLGPFINLAVIISLLASISAVAILSYLLLKERGIIRG
ncbi:MAG: hypothetical protein ACFE95_05775 [Candidatus Hodarchaeota archaeon]